MRTHTFTADTSGTTSSGTDVDHTGAHTTVQVSEDGDDVEATPQTAVATDGGEDC